MNAKKNIFYITRSYPSIREHAGGSSLLRKATVDLLRKEGFNVTVITPNYGSKELIEDKSTGVVLVPFTKNEKIGRLLQRFGIVEDYLDQWVDHAVTYLAGKIQKSDIALSTTGGELASIKMSHILKQKYDCFNIVNFRDPINYAQYQGLKRDNLFHINRNKLELKYLNNADIIITSCKSFQTCLIEKYPRQKSIIINNYFGYISSITEPIPDKNSNSLLRIVYGGNFSRTQSPETICEVVSSHPDRNLIDLTLIGNYTNYRAVDKYLDQFNFLKMLPHEQFSKYLLENAMVGFVPLHGDYYKFCFPSKIYEYLNHGLVLLGSLPRGDALEFINKHEYGIAVDYNDRIALQKAVSTLLDKHIYSKYLQKVQGERLQWSMENQIKTLIKSINSL